MSRKSKTKLQDVDFKQIEEILERSQLNEEDRELLRRVAQSYAYLTELVEDKNTSIQRLRKLLFGSKSEKTRKVLDKEEEDSGETPRSAAAASEEGSAAGPKTKPKGHGRNGAKNYRGGERIKVPHPNLCSGDTCPECNQGKVYTHPEPGVTVRVKGTAPLQAKVYEFDKLRCNLCGKIFTAEPPKGIGQAKYDETAASMIALMKYGSGLPFNRLAGLQGNLGIPLPPSTQWDLVHGVAQQIAPAFDELIRQGAGGQVVYNDDTGMKILELTGERRKKEAFSNEQPLRKGIFTSGIVSTNEDRKIALFFTGPKHAGENLEQVLEHREPDQPMPIQMCDALSRNTCGDFETIVANCLAHGRRGFVDVAANFPAECRHVLETLKEVYKNEAGSKKLGLSPEQRLDYHRSTSRRLMVKLRLWMRNLFREKKVEPNSGLGEAMAYMRKHWKKLTLFFRVAGAPLDNNICERALKKVILHRKNSYFFKTQNGAYVSDIYMSLIYTCQLCGANPFDYLTELQKHSKELAHNPAEWMPWSFRDTRARLGSVKV